MKVVTAIDSFKGSMTSMEAGFAAAAGIHRGCQRRGSGKTAGRWW